MTSDVPRHTAAPRLEQAEAKVAELEEEVVQLKQAVASHQDIGQAIGIVMAVARVSPADAWDVVREVSQRTNTKLRQVASLLTEWSLSGSLPTEVRTELDRQLRLRRGGAVGMNGTVRVTDPP
ncbi:ANTAR domain-containing protein [Streptomyces sp. NPDC050264]|uniref:ANTAR domain-containing protein n=1 Tax=Streptomyces sp. NPDC050264 TaxID=3155038 RepID=UPI0034156373